MTLPAFAIQKRAFNAALSLQIRALASCPERIDSTAASAGPPLVVYISEPCRGAVTTGFHGPQGTARVPGVKDKMSFVNARFGLCAVKGVLILAGAKPAR